MENQTYDCPTDEAVETAVMDFTDLIVLSAKRNSPGCEIDLDFDPLLNSNETTQSKGCTITTDLGVVQVFPDFRGRSSSAAVVKIGEMNHLRSEGFDESQIVEVGKVYGKPFPASPENAEIFGYYLTHKIDFSSK
jgi:hypothetical protein